MSVVVETRYCCFGCERPLRRKPRADQHRHDLGIAAQLGDEARLPGGLKVEVLREAFVGGRRLAQLAKRRQHEAVEGLPAHALALELLWRHGDHVATELRRVAEREPAQIGIRNREKEDAVGCGGDRLGELLQARRAGKGGVGESGRCIQADARVADLNREGRRQRRAPNKEQGDERLYVRPRFAAMRMRSAFRRMKPPASA
jgi:hypothetical protein